MLIEFIEDNSLEKFEESFFKIEKDAKAILILSCDENDYPLNAINPIL